MDWARGLSRHRKDRQAGAVTGCIAGPADAGFIVWPGLRLDPVGADQYTLPVERWWPGRRGSLKAATRL
jgi:hypothetical protein